MKLNGLYVAGERCKYDATMTIPPPDGSRDRRIEDPTNLWLIHPAGRALLPWALARGISANAVSIAGLCLGAAAAAAFYQWHHPLYAVVGLLLAIGWMVADGLDGMVARATRTASPFGRVLDGLCDHGVFALIYLALAISVGTAEGWAFSFAAGIAHAVQSSLYEGDRARYHRRVKAIAPPPVTPAANHVVRFYDRVSTSLDRIAAPFDALFRTHYGPQVAAGYGDRAAAPMRLMALLTANVRVWTLFLACLAGRPALFWWAQIVPLTLVAIVAIVWHRRVEARLLQRFGAGAPSFSPTTFN